MQFIQLGYVVLLWTVPVLLTWRSFTKMKEEKRQEVLREVKRPLFLLGVAPIMIGLLVFFTSSVSVPKIIVLEYFGLSLIFFGWCVIWGEELISRNKNTRKAIVMIGLGICVLVSYLYFFKG